MTESDVDRLMFDIEGIVTEAMTLLIRKITRRLEDIEITEETPEEPAKPEKENT